MQKMNACLVFHVVLGCLRKCCNRALESMFACNHCRAKPLLSGMHMMLASCHVEMAHLTAGCFDACMDIGLPFEDTWSESAPPCGKGGVLGTGLDICFCSECVSSAFASDSGERGQHCTTPCKQTAVEAVEAARAQALAGDSGERGQHRTTPCKQTAVEDLGVHGSMLAAAGMPQSPCRTGSQGTKPARGAPVPQKGAALASADSQPSAERQLKLLKRKEKNRLHAHLSRIRQNEKNVEMLQNEARLEEECARLRALVRKLEHEQEGLKTDLVVEMYLC